MSQSAVSQTMDVGISLDEILPRVRHLEIRAKHLVEDSLSSEYHSVFKGRGIEFNEVRNYNVGDDIRDIDWNVTARMNEPFIKTYIEERQLSVYFMVDASASGSFGSNRSKREIMAEVTALLGFATFFNNDRAGLILFSEDIDHTLPPRKNYSHLLRMIRDSWCIPGKNRGTGIAKSLESALRMIKKRSIIFILSDFLDSGYEKSLAMAAKKHDVIPIIVSDPAERGFSAKGIPAFLKRLPISIDLEDSETGKQSTRLLSEMDGSAFERSRKATLKLFKKYGLDYAEVSDQSDYFREVEMLMKRRLRKNKLRG